MNEQRVMAVLAVLTEFARQKDEKLLESLIKEALKDTSEYFHMEEACEGLAEMMAYVAERRVSWVIKEETNEQ